MKYETWWSQSCTLNDDRIAESSRVEISSLQPRGKIWRNHPQNPSPKTHQKNTNKLYKVHQLRTPPRKLTAGYPKWWLGKGELPLNHGMAVCWYQNWCFSLGSAADLPDPSLARGNGICLNALICRSLRPAVKRFRSWSVGGFFTEDGRWEWRCWNRGVLPSNKWGSKTWFGVVRKCCFFFFFRLIRDDCLRNLKNPCEAAKITIRVLKILDQFWKMNFRRIFSQNSQIVFQ